MHLWEKMQILKKQVWKNKKEQTKEKIKISIRFMKHEKIQVRDKNA